MHGKSLVYVCIYCIHSLCYATVSDHVNPLYIGGERGWQPIGHRLRAAYRDYGIKAVRLMPTLFWINSSDFALRLFPAIGYVFYSFFL
jgi:hypothetical protein